MIYLDNASTTKMFSEVLEVYNKVSNDNYYNASAMYTCGLNSKNLINESRNTISKALGANNFDVIFTGSATEANNMAIQTFANRKNKNFVFSYAEHPSVFNVAKELEGKGIDVRYVNLTKDGKVDFDDFKSKVDENTCFVSIMQVCNETGAVNDIKELVVYAKSKNKSLVFHVDGVQAFLKIPVNLANLGVDLYTISAHKVNGPKGVGALLVKKGVNVNPLVFGGGQENNKRSGTENVAGIVAFAKAVEINFANLMEEYNRILNLKQKLYDGISKTENFRCYTFVENSSPYILQCSFVGVRAETMLHMLEENNILISNGSACSSKKSGNRILDSMGLSQKEVESSIRISIGHYNTEMDIDNAINSILNANEKYLKITNKGR